MARRWIASKHPRDSRGRFAKKGSRGSSTKRRVSAANRRGDLALKANVAIQGAVILAPLIGRAYYTGKIALQNETFRRYAQRAATPEGARAIARTAMKAAKVTRGVYNITAMR